MKKILLLFVLSIILFACDLEYINNDIAQTNVEVEDNSEDKINEEIKLILDKKIDALVSKDLDKYVMTVSKLDKYYIREQERWFTEMTKDGMDDIKFEVLDIELLDENHLVANIRQTHYYRGNFDINYPLLFIKENELWFDAGYNFLNFETDKYTIKYMEGERHLTEFNELIDVAYENLELIFDEKPDENFQIKLFHNREMLRQRSIPSIEWLFTGWGEADESLKLYTGHDSLDGYKGTIQHELVHHITMRICNNNLPGWIAEGIAMQYGIMILDNGNAITINRATKDQVNVTIDYLESLDLYTETDRNIVQNWYNASQMYTEYLIEIYGHEKLMELFYEAGKKPYNSSVMNPDFEFQNFTTLSEVFMLVLGKTKEEISSEYLLWLDENY